MALKSRHLSAILGGHFLRQLLRPAVRRTPTVSLQLVLHTYACFNCCAGCTTHWTAAVMCAVKTPISDLRSAAPCTGPTHLTVRFVSACKAASLRYPTWRPQHLALIGCELRPVRSGAEVGGRYAGMNTRVSTGEARCKSTGCPAAHS
jgi:hypothetical protein